eukprot:CAMPEP_0170573282 /NCGR_PEP_ID=MMETSP0224-20130122/2683_1 /TAXON_ID=285029 /ORGANISM="Togula jolla, Strain CCCM 725" /LENGTH=259 /DNA_ID=CAMNT_0010895861 /DNA_START=8 /DNA_END=787 /DNA_ORIENTATION=+
MPQAPAPRPRGALGLGASADGGGSGSLVPGPATAYVLGAVAVVLVARVARRLTGRQGRNERRRPEVARRAEKEGDADVPGVMYRAVNARSSGGKQGQGSWMMPDANEEETAARAPPPKQTYGVWINMKKQVPDMLTSWAEAATPEQAEVLRSLSAKELPKEWTVWGLVDADKLDGGGGLYLAPPCEPQALVFSEAVDAEVINVHHIAMNPQELGAGSRRAVNGWLDSLLPKRAIIKQPEELALFGLEVGGEAAKVSKGL